MNNNDICTSKEEMMKDDYEKYFHQNEEANFRQEIRAMEQESFWIPENDMKNVKITITKPELESQAEADDLGVDIELVKDTNAHYGLKISTGYDYTLRPADSSLVEPAGFDEEDMFFRRSSGAYLVRPCALNGLQEIVKVKGKGVTNNLKLRCNHPIYCSQLNGGFRSSTGKLLLLKRCGKITAAHSDSDGGYEIMPIPNLINLTTEMIESRFGERQFWEGYNSHSYTSCVWTLPDAQEELLKKYNEALDKAYLKTGVRSKFPPTYLPALRFKTSDVGSNNATLEPLFFTGQSNIPVRFVSGVKVKHTKRGLGEQTGCEVFREEIDNIFAKFEDSAEIVQALAEKTIKHGSNCAIYLCKEMSISRSYGEPARAEIELIADDNGSINAYDFYLCFSNIIAEAVQRDASAYRLNELEESVASVPRMLISDIDKYDLGGNVTW